MKHPYEIRVLQKYFEDEELYDALFKHMKGSSSPGPDGFTVNWLRQFWPEMKDLTREALNSSTTGLTRTLRLAIIKILRKGTKDPTEATSYRPISLLTLLVSGYFFSHCIRGGGLPDPKSIWLFTRLVDLSHK